MAVVLAVLASCLPEPEPAIDQATVLADNTSVRIGASSSSRTLFMLDAGDRVDILEKEGSWYRIRDVERIEGWMDESTLLRDTTRSAMDALVADARQLPVQNTATTSDAVNLRLTPGRDTAIIRRLRRGVPLEILDRATTSRPESDATDIWYLVRPNNDEVGWVYYQLVNLDAPPALRPFMEERTYTAVVRLKTDEDPEVGQVDWWVVGERRNGTDPRYAFDGIRVFIWNLQEHQYETTLRLRNLRGVFPLERIDAGEQPGFRFHVLDADGNRVTREFVMIGTVPREIR